MDFPAITVGLGNAKYSYAQGRLSGMYSKMYSQRDYESFLQSRGAFEVITTLENSDYAREVGGIKSDGVNPESIEAALMKHFKRVLKEVSSMIPAREAAELNIVFLGEWDARNVSTIVGGILSGMQSSEIISSLSPLGLMDGNLIEAASKAPTIDGLCSIMPEYSVVIKRAVQYLGDDKSLSSLKSMVERDILVSKIGVVGGALKWYLRLRVEAIDVALAFRAKSSGFDPLKYSSGVRAVLDGRRFDELVQSDVVGAVKALSETRYGSILQDYVKNIDDPDYILRQLNSFVDRELGYRAMMNPLSQYFILKYVKDKYNETSRLKTILIGKHLGLSPDELGRLIK
ncbi:MAG: V-type ATPase subunit [Candidatus Altiarchaeota archaeon]